MIGYTTKTGHAGLAYCGLPDTCGGPCMWRRAAGCAFGTSLWGVAILAGILSVSILGSASLAAQSLATEWVQGHNVRTRLVAGHVPVGKPGSGQATTSLAAGLEMELTPGWKTYWRIPGDAGGVPPEFDWSESENVASAVVYYPAPRRLTDRAGSTIGYKDHVVFPVLIEAKDSTRPVKLRLMLAFGVCHDICVPSEGTYEIAIPPGGAPLSNEIKSALARVPTPAAAIRTEAENMVPRLAKVETDLAAAEPTVTLHVLFPGGTKDADVFVEGPVGEYVPMTVHKGEGAEGAQIYVIELSKGADVAALKGQSLRVTMVSEAGQAEASFILQ